MERRSNGSASDPAHPPRHRPGGDPTKIVNLRYKLSRQQSSPQRTQLLIRRHEDRWAVWGDDDPIPMMLSTRRHDAYAWAVELALRDGLDLHLVRDHGGGTVVRRFRDTRTG
jgi:hypothetical protein